MNLENFIAELKASILSILPPSYELVVKSVTKNNNQVKTGFMFKLKEKNYAPTLYAEDFYNSSVTKEDIPSVAQTMLDSLMTARPEDISLLDQIGQYTTIRDKICFKLINTQKNSEFLENVPSISLLDLSLVPIILCQNTSTNNMASSVITNQLIKSWNISKEELLLNAAKNAELLMPPVFRPLSDYLPIINEFEIPEESTLYILTNKQKYLGSICITYPNILEHIAEKLNGSFYIIPSSIHELLITKKEEGKLPSIINQSIKEVNSTCLSPDEFLSNHAYYYDKDDNRLIGI